MSKKNKRRQCPALGREITSAECGADRISHIACTADCPFNTFSEANYDAMGEVEDSVIRKTQERLCATLGYDRMRAFTEQVMGAGEDTDLVHYYHLREMHLVKDSSGRSFIDRWEAENWKGLNNDERTIMQGHRQTRPVLLEIQQVLSDISFQAVDLLRPGSEPIVVVDRSVAERARRFQTFSGWVFPAPHFVRISGSGRIIQESGRCSPLETVREIARHLGGPDDLPGLEQWLWTERLRFLDAYEAVTLARIEKGIAQSDAIRGRADYRVTGSSSALRDLIAAQPDMDPDPLKETDRLQGFDCAFLVRQPVDVAKPAALGPETFLGAVLIGEDWLCVEASSRAGLERLKCRVQELAGSRIKFDDEHVVDLAKQQMASQSGPDVDMSLVPPRLLEEPPVFAVTMQRAPADDSVEGRREADRSGAQRVLDSLPDKSVPLLNGLTPREAAADPALRPALIQFMKRHILGVDDMRRRRGLDVDLNPVLEELGLLEIIFPPVPLPEVPEEEDAYDDDVIPDDEYEDGEAEAEAAADRWEPLDEQELSHIPKGVQQEWLKARSVRAPLGMSEVERVTKQIVRNNEALEEAVDWLQTNWPQLSAFLGIEDPYATLDIVEALVMHGAALAARALFPGASRDGDINFDRLELFWITEARSISEAVRMARWQELQDILVDGPQPNLTSMIASQVLAMVEQKPPVLSPFEARQLLPLLKAIVRELSLLEPD